MRYKNCLFQIKKNFNVNISQNKTFYDKLDLNV